MNIQEIISKLFEEKKGILAFDESVQTAEKRLSMIGLENTAENRLLYRKVLLESQGIEEYLSGVILSMDTAFEEVKEGVTLADYLASRGIIPGVKVDLGLRTLQDFEPDTYTKGLDDLSYRMEEYKNQGIQFTKWRSTIRVGGSMESIHTNALLMALYASEVQSKGIVPIVEPEVLYEGLHTIEECYETCQKTIDHTMYQLERMRVDLSGVILKTSMVLSGKDSGEQDTPEEVGTKTVRMLNESTRSNLGGVVFLSGGQTSNQAIKNLKAITDHNNSRMKYTYSFGRALQEPALLMWCGKDENRTQAESVFLDTLKMISESI